MGRGIASLATVIGLLASACATRSAPPRVGPATAANAGTNDTAPGGEVGLDDAQERAGDGTSDGADGDEPETTADATDGECPRGMVVVHNAQTARRFCVDKYEASLVEVMPDGTERPFAHFSPVDGHDVRAVSQPHVFPQGFISEVQADDACVASGKRLCSHDEWKTACMGPTRTTFPYGDARRPGACHDTGKSAVGAVFGAKALASAPATPAASGASRAFAPSPATAPPSGAKTGRHAHSTKGRAASTVKTRATASAKTGPARGTAKSAPQPSARHAPAKKDPRSRRTGKLSTRPPSVDASVWTKLNDPALGQVDGALAKTGEHDQCVNGFGVLDMVGNLHEWVATDRSAPHGTFAGGYYLDTTINGDGCNYKTQAHAHDYHDYSTGFRCCADVAPPHAP